MDLRFRRLNAVPFALLLVLGVAHVAAPQVPLEEETDERVTDYVIGPEDLLDIVVWDNAQMSRSVPVRPDGKISLPLVDDVRAAGLTPMQLRDVLTTALAPYIPLPTLSVIVREVNSFKVTVIGEVTAPGRYAMKSRSTVIEALAMAGGPTEYADRGHIVVMRREGVRVRRIPFSFDKLTEGNDTEKNGSPKNAKGRSENFDLEPGDIILVP